MTPNFWKQVREILKRILSRLWAIIMGAGVILGTAAALDYFFKIRWWLFILGLIVLGTIIILIAPLIVIIRNAIDKSKLSEKCRFQSKEIKDLKKKIYSLERRKK